MIQLLSLQSASGPNWSDPESWVSTRRSRPSGSSIRLNKISLKAQEGLATLASATGGAAFLPDNAEDLDKVFRQITAELQAQYLLGYYSPDERADGGFRRITVRVPKRPDLRIRARQCYYAPKV